MKLATMFLLVGVAILALASSMAPFKDEALFMERYMALTGGQSAEYWQLRADMLTPKFQLQYRSKELTIIKFVWAPCMSLMPHNHQMFSVVGIYSGREDNVLWRRSADSIEAIGAKSLGAGDVVVLGRDTIHSVLNPIAKMTCAVHVYGGDFFAPEQPRSQWDHETLTEQPWDIEQVKHLFAAAERRFKTVPQ